MRLLDSTRSHCALKIPGIIFVHSQVCHPDFGLNSTCGLVAMTSASHAEGRQSDPGQV